MHSSSLEQVALSAFIQDGHYARHVHKVCKACYERQQMLIVTIQDYLIDVLKPYSLIILGFISCIG